MIQGGVPLPDAVSFKDLSKLNSLLELGLGLQVLVTRATQLQEMCPKCQNTILCHKLIESLVTETTLAKLVNA
jgi:hypothetical protein